MRVPNGQVRVKCVEIGDDYAIINVEEKPDSSDWKWKKKVTDAGDDCPPANAKWKVEIAQSYMKTENVFALLVAVLMPCLATFGQSAAQTPHRAGRSALQRAGRPDQRARWR